MRKYRTEELLAECSKLRREGLTLTQIAKRVGVSRGAVQSWMEGRFSSPVRHTTRSGAHGAQVDLMANALAKLIPPDTRDITARLCGDPLPGRRAIDRIEMRKVKGEVPLTG